MYIAAVSTRSVVQLRVMTQCVRICANWSHCRLTAHNTAVCVGYQALLATYYKVANARLFFLSFFFCLYTLIVLIHSVILLP